jgi:NAD(P)-dependent dehydrogenase (short-subunit alcohol dehydrogenase family)
MRKWSEADIPDLAGKRALVTGAASGIGFEAARALALRGAEVLLVDRNEEASRTALQRIHALRADARLRVMPLDLGSQKAIRDFAATLLAEDKPLDLLINNAGIQPISERRCSFDGFELTFGIGHLGHFALTGLLLPLLLCAKAPRVVTVSSMVHGKGFIDWDDLQIERNYSSQRPYNQTKLANLLFARELQRRADAAGKQLLSLAVHPGVAQTSIGANRKQLGSYRAADHMISVVLSFVLPFLGQPAAAGALPTLYAATSADVTGGGFYGPDGYGEMKGSPAVARIKAAGQDMDAAKQLWEVSRELTGIGYEALLD